MQSFIESFNAQSRSAREAVLVPTPQVKSGRAATGSTGWRLGSEEPTRERSRMCSTPPRKLPLVAAPVVGQPTGECVRRGEAVGHAGENPQLGVGGLDDRSTACSASPLDVPLCISSELDKGRDA